MIFLAQSSQISQSAEESEDFSRKCLLMRKPDLHPGLPAMSCAPVEPT